MFLKLSFTSFILINTLDGYKYDLQENIFISENSIKITELSTSEFYHNGSVYMAQWQKYTLEFPVGRTELTAIPTGFCEQYPWHDMASLGCQPAAENMI